MKLDLHPGIRSKGNVRIDMDSRLRGGRLAGERRGSPRLRQERQFGAYVTVNRTFVLSAAW